MRRLRALFQRAAVSCLGAGIFLISGMAAAESPISTPGGNVDWKPWAHPDGRTHWYAVVKTATLLDWDESEAAAEALGGHLATITSAAENAFVFSLVQATGDIVYWLGGFQPPGSPEPDGNWQWITGEPFSYTNWWYGEPNNAGVENRIEFHPFGAGQWNDRRAANDRVDEYAPVGYIAEVSTGFSKLTITQARLRFLQDQQADHENAEPTPMRSECSPRTDKDSAYFLGQIQLSDDSNGINPLIETVKVTVGSYDITIPPGSFTKASCYQYRGSIDGADVLVRLTEGSANVFRFVICANGIDLAGTANPVKVSLSIGDDRGETQERLKGILHR